VEPNVVVTTTLRNENNRLLTLLQQAQSQMETLMDDNENLHLKQDNLNIKV